MKKDEKIIVEIYKEIFEDNFHQYSKRLNRQSIENNKDDTFSQVNKVFISLSEKEKNAIMNMIKIVISDTASTILGTLDGTHMVDNIDKDFQLIYDNEEIQGDLQDLFLALVEDNNDII